MSVERDYSNREIDAVVKNLENKMDGYHTETVMEIQKLGVKVDKTNGSVGNLKAWRTGITMVVAVIAFVVIPLIIYSFQLSQENLKNTILLEIQNK